MLANNIVKENVIEEDEDMISDKGGGDNGDKFEEEKVADHPY